PRGRRRSTPRRPAQVASRAPYGPVKIVPLIPTAKTCPPGSGAAQIPWSRGVAAGIASTVHPSPSQNSTVPTSTEPDTAEPVEKTRPVDVPEIATTVPLRPAFRFVQVGPPAHRCALVPKVMKTLFESWAHSAPVNPLSDALPSAVAVFATLSRRSTWACPVTTMSVGEITRI